ncbi:MAG TPA: DNA polymerase III subunit gamma and tau [Acidothermaceae bacterium]|jgi:DNA polymerase-3 subunit gamma/tau
MSLALYRKYRPSTFAEVIGQEHVTEPLQQALRNDRVHHAYLFSGPRGCGKTSSARILARSLNCEQGPTPTPCGVCESCVALAPSGPGSIDVIEIDAASHGGVDDARDLRERSFYAPIQARFKIYIIDEAHMVTTAGFNALLKLVEEPPPHLKFIFATTEPEKVIGTIRSRTHHYPFRLVPPGALRENLARICVAEGVTIEPAALGLVVRAGAGSVRDAQSVLDQLVAGASADGVTYSDAVALLGYTDASLLDDVVDAFGAGDGGAVLEIVDRVVEAGHDPRRFAEDLLERLRDLIVLNAVPDAGEKGLLDVPVDVLERMSRQSAQLGRVQLTRAADIVNTGLTEMRGATAPRLLLELICARVLLPAVGDDEASLLVRLERLERRFAIAGDSEVVAAPTVSRAAAVSAPTRAVPPAEPAPTSATPPAVAAPPSDPESLDGAASFDSAASFGSSPFEPAVSPPGAIPASSPLAAGDLDAAAVRRIWDDVLEVAKRLKRRTHALLLSGPAQVVDVRANVLVVGFASGPVERQFNTGDNVDILQVALKEVLGVDWRIETTLSGPAATAAASADGESATKPPPPLPTPSESMAADRAPSRTAAARAAAVEPKEPRVRRAAVADAPAEIVLDEPNPDDDDADDGTSGLALLQRHLGATVIGDNETP